MSNFYTESFDQFASRLGPTDIALYAGAGLVLWVLFKDKLSPVQSTLLNLINKFKKTDKASAVTPVLPVVGNEIKPVELPKEDLFFQLITSWKQTRDLAVKSECAKAVEIADQMFQFLSPSVCEDNNDKQ